jgi:carbon monoxide dehydrogenase subunit G
MQLQYSGEQQVPVSLDKVWAFVTDPQKVGQCFPDVVDVTVQDATHFEAIVAVGVGPVRGRFKMKVELQPADAMHRIEMSMSRRIDMKMSGGGFGSNVDLTGGADLLDAGGGATLLRWGGQAEVRGPVAAVGGRVLDAQAQKLIARAFDNVRQQLTA